MGGGKPYKPRVRRGVMTPKPESLAQTVSALGRAFKDTNTGVACDGETIQIYNRTHDEVEADIAAYLTYAPFCIVDTYGSVIDAAGWENPDVNELFCIVLNDANKAGTYTFYLYYQGTLTFSYPVSLGIGWSAFWYAGNGEVPGNGEYQVDIRDPDGIAIATRTFTIINYPAPPTVRMAMSINNNTGATVTKDLLAGYGAYNEATGEFTIAWGAGHIAVPIPTGTSVKNLDCVAEVQGIDFDVLAAIGKFDASWNFVIEHRLVKMAQLSVIGTTLTFSQS